MLIITLRTDKPESEIGLYQDDQQIDYYVWQAHRRLAETIHTKIEELMKKHSKDWEDIEGLVGFEGPGSFTGLRIGLTVLNALAYSNNIKVVGASGEHWINQGMASLLSGQGQKVILPEYGTEAFTTPPKK